MKVSLNVDPINNPLPDYSREDDGSLSKCLELVKNDDYYPGFFDKAAYLFASIIENHFFSNGNKRLAWMVLIYFLKINGWSYRRRSTQSLKDVAIYVADKEANQQASFDVLKNYVKSYLQQNVTEISQ